MYSQIKSNKKKYCYSVDKKDKKFQNETETVRDKYKRRSKSENRKK